MMKSSKTTSTVLKELVLSEVIDKEQFDEAFEAIGAKAEASGGTNSSSSLSSSSRFIRPSSQSLSLTDLLPGPSQSLQQQLQLLPIHHHDEDCEEQRQPLMQELQEEVRENEDEINACRCGPCSTTGSEFPRDELYSRPGHLTTTNNNNNNNNKSAKAVLSLRTSKVSLTTRSRLFLLRVPFLFPLLLLAKNDHLLPSLFGCCMMVDAFDVMYPSSSSSSSSGGGGADPQHELANSFIDGGCLYQRKQGWTKKRVCSSIDVGTNHAELGYCRPSLYYNGGIVVVDDNNHNKDNNNHGIHNSDDQTGTGSHDDDDELIDSIHGTMSPLVFAPFNYQEIRIFAQNWDSAIFETWMLQVILSEVLDVPTSVETGHPTNVVDLYDRQGRRDYGNSSKEEEAFQMGVKIGDCRILMKQNQLAIEKNNTEYQYQACAHFVPEKWDAEELSIDDMWQKGIIEPGQGMGMIGEEHWFIPKFTAERDPTLLSYVGMSGEQNRQKLAERFGRPVRWGEYCTDVVARELTNCSDSTSTREPSNTTEEDAFFVQGLYNGYFRHDLDENDCTNYPTNCTGHIIDYPCGWTSFIGPQLYHLNIALSSSGREPNSHGYKYDEMVQILLAANYTKSDVVVYWWTPEALYQQFLGTDMELTQVVMPPVTKECLDHRIKTDDRCSADLATRVGHPLGVCDEAPHIIAKLIGGRLFDDVYAPHITPPLYSPAYDVLRAFQVSGAEVGQIFDYWLKRRGGNTSSIDDGARVAICDWVVDNFDTLESFIPRNYPRTMQEKPNVTRGALPVAAISVASIAIVVVLVASATTYRQRHRLVMKHAQVEFLWLLLAGLLLVSIGALLIGIPPSSDGECVAAVWTTNVGYSLELVPLIVKMAAFYKLMRAARKMRHVQVTVRMLYGAVLLLTFVVIIFLITWTVLDAPHLGTEYDLTEETTDEGEFIVTTSHYCTSNSQAWLYASVGWHLTLLTAATIQTIQTRSIRQEINESQTLAIMIYSHFVFLILRLITLFLRDTLNQTDLMGVTSLIFSLDAIATIGIYFVPKFLTDDRANGRSGEFVMESSTVRKLQMLAAVATAQHERQLMVDRGHGPSFDELTESVVPMAAGHALSVLADPTTQQEVQSTLAHFKPNTMLPTHFSTVTTFQPTGSTVSTADHDFDSRHSCPKCGETVELLRFHHQSTKGEQGDCQDEEKGSSLDL